MADIYRLEIPTGILYVPIETTVTSTLVFGVPARKIVVLSAWFVAQTNVNVKFQTSTGPLDITGPAYCIGNGGVVMPFNAGGWCQTAVGDSLLINLSGSTGVGGCLTYSLV